MLAVNFPTSSTLMTEKEKPSARDSNHLSGNRAESVVCNHDFPPLITTPCALCLHLFPEVVEDSYWWLTQTFILGTCEPHVNWVPVAIVKHLSLDVEVLGGTPENVLESRYILFWLHWQEQLYLPPLNVRIKYLRQSVTPLGPLTLQHEEPTRPVSSFSFQFV